MTPKKIEMDSPVELRGLSFILYIYKVIEQGEPPKRKIGYYILYIQVELKFMIVDLA